MTFIETWGIHVTVSAKEDLSETEKEELLKFIQGQLSDGWGEDDFSFNRNGTTYNLLFWDNTGWYIKCISPDD